MNEKIKIAEAKYFLNRMREVESHYDEFSYNLSAFLASARTVMQYMHDETENNGNLQWYVDKMSNSDILKFFKSTRDLIIHVIPCQLIKDVLVQVPPQKLNLTVSAVAISSSGGIVYGPPMEIVSTHQQAPVAIHTYKFDMDWYNQAVTGQYTASEKQLCQRLCQQYDVITFCGVYVKELEAIINGGIQKGMITG